MEKLLKFIVTILPILFILVRCQDPINQDPVSQDPVSQNSVSQDPKCEPNAKKTDCKQATKHCEKIGQKDCYITVLKRTRKNTQEKFGDWKVFECDCISPNKLDICFIKKVDKDGDEQLNKKFKCAGERCEQNKRKSCKLILTPRDPKNSLSQIAKCRCMDK